MNPQELHDAQIAQAPYSNEINRDDASIQTLSEKQFVAIMNEQIAPVIMTISDTYVLHGKYLCIDVEIQKSITANGFYRMSTDKYENLKKGMRVKFDRKANYGVGAKYAPWYFTIVPFE